jgi:hypothetical protein
MKDEYVKFGTAKILKEKGFDWFTYSYYTKDDVDEKPYFGMENLCPDNWNGEVDEVNDLWFSAPTQQMACRWLREEHNIHIEPHFLRESSDYVYDIIHSPLELDDIHSFPIVFNTREDAVEAALEYVLKNLI